MIALARAAHIPARMASVYALRVAPQDFHAVAEVYLDGDWHMVDATGMTRPAETARICTGRDAADIAFLPAYREIQFPAKTVPVERVEGRKKDAAKPTSTYPVRVPSRDRSV